VFAAIPYTTFPNIALGPLNLRTFGLMVAIGVLVGCWVAAAYAERFGIARDETYRVATWVILAAIIGSRLTWALTHTDQIHSLVDVIAIWQGGIQFSGGFICGLIAALPFIRRWGRLQRWQVLDGWVLGVTVGLAIGRIGCYSVGEHFGRTSDFFLAVRYDGGQVRESTLGDIPLQPGMTFHNTALYEALYMALLFVVLGALVLRAHRQGREVAPGTLGGIFLVYYGVARFLSDSLRVNDERIGGLTGAQWMCLVMIPFGIWVLWKVRPTMARLAAEQAAAETAEPEPAADAAGEPAGEPEPDAEAEPEPAESGADETETETVASTTGPETEDVVATGTDGTTVVTASDDHEATVPQAER
jgi:phosphatidylglycerol:prolipoprotein diacylglycerol transferase